MAFLISDHCSLFELHPIGVQENDVIHHHSNNNNKNGELFLRLQNLQFGGIRYANNSIVVVVSTTFNVPKNTCEPNTILPFEYYHGGFLMRVQYFHTLVYMTMGKHIVYP